MGKAKPTGLKSIKPRDDFGHSSKKRKGRRHPANCVFVIVYMSDQITLNYVVCIYFASPGASHLLNCVIQ